MKKISTLLLSAGLLAFAAGCTSSEIIDEGAPELRGAISFGTTNVSKPSRAAVQGTVGNSNFDEFYVYGSYTNSQVGRINVFTGEKTVKTVDEQNKAVWSYEGGDRYWLPGSVYTFRAFSCGNSGAIDATTGKPGNARLVDGELDITGYTVHTDHDLIYAKSGSYTGLESNNPIVPLEFKHILTRLKFSFTCKTPGNDYVIDVKDIKLNGLYNKADYSGANEMWTNHSENTTAVPLSATETEIPSDKALECAPIFVIPNAYVQVDDKNPVQLIFTMVVSHMKGTEKEPLLTRTVSASWVPNWEQGKSLNNVVNIEFANATGLEPIKFSASVVPVQNPDNDGWVEAEGGLTDKNIVFQVVD